MALPVGQQDCDWIDIVQVPRDNPGGASFVRREPLEGGHAAHDNGVILGDVNMLATASGHMSNVFDIGDNAMQRPEVVVAPDAAVARAAELIAEGKERPLHAWDLVHCPPGAKHIFADVCSPIALDFLTRYPTSESAQRLGEARMRAFLTKHGYSGRRPAAQLLTRLHAAPPGLVGVVRVLAHRPVVG